MLQQAGQVNAIVPFKLVDETSAVLRITSNGSPAPPVPLRRFLAGLLAGPVQVNCRVLLNLPASTSGTGYPDQKIVIVIGGDQKRYSTNEAVFVR